MLLKPLTFCLTKFSRKCVQFSYALPWIILSLSNQSWQPWSEVGHVEMMTHYSRVITIGNVPHVL